MTPERTLPIDVLERKPEPSAVIPLSPRMTPDEWSLATNAIDEVMSWIEQRGIAPTGPPYFRYLVVGSNTVPFEMEVGVTVSEPVEGDGRVIASTVPGGIYATCTYKGHPDYLYLPHIQLDAWAEAQGLTFSTHDRDGTTVMDARYELFVTDPDDEPDVNTCITHVASLFDETSKLDERVQEWKAQCNQNIWATD